MQVTVIGAENMGRGIGHRLVAGGHEVTVVDRDPEEVAAVRERLRAAGIQTEDSAGSGFIVRDPWEIAVRFSAEASAA